VAKILDGYHLTQDWVIVCGDLNDDPTSPQLKPLLDLYNLHDVLELQFPGDPPRHWTYHYDDFEQIDYILVSTPLKQRFLGAGVERRASTISTRSPRQAASLTSRPSIQPSRTGRTPFRITVPCGLISIVPRSASRLES
jgi:endonuclease/exonuclease/phosphatase family metal-dependent hydrolase